MFKHFRNISVVVNLEQHMLVYLIHSLFDFAQTNIKMHLLLFQFTAFLIEQVGIMINEVQVVTWSDGHGPATTLC